MLLYFNKMRIRTEACSLHMLLYCNGSYRSCHSLAQNSAAHVSCNSEAHMLLYFNGSYLSCNSLAQNSAAHMCHVTQKLICYCTSKVHTCLATHWLRTQQLTCHVTQKLICYCTSKVHTCLATHWLRTQQLTCVM